MAFELPPLPYAYDALQPLIDAETMRIHHDLHHATYTTNANAAVEGHADLAARSAEDLIRNLGSVPEAARTAVRNQVGGHLNHSLFWQMMAPPHSTSPSPALTEAIDSVFGSLESFKTAFNDGGAKRFGSGWVWLVRTASGRLEIVSTANQDSPLTDGHEVLLGNDVWEHAYYLTYRNRRAEYLSKWWDVANWDEASRRFEAAKG